MSYSPRGGGEESPPLPPPQLPYLPPNTEFSGFLLLKSKRDRECYALVQESVSFLYKGSESKYFRLHGHIGSLFYGLYFMTLSAKTPSHSWLAAWFGGPSLVRGLSLPKGTVGPFLLPELMDVCSVSFHLALRWVCCKITFLHTWCHSL